MGLFEAIRKLGRKQDEEQEKGSSDRGPATLTGEAPSQADKEKIALATNNSEAEAKSVADAAEADALYEKRKDEALAKAAAKGPATWWLRG